MRCLKWHGRHGWSAWTESLGLPKQEKDGRIYRQKLQSRVCDWCNYTEQVWLPSAKVIEPLASEEESDG